MSAPAPALSAAGAIIGQCRCAFAFAAGRDWMSYDPFDLLLAPIGEPLRRRWPLAARVLIQLGRRSGAGVRRLVGVRPHEEAKAIADFLAAGAQLAGAPEAAWAADYLQPLSDRLQRLAITIPQGRGWGLSFPYASRFVSVPAGTPNGYTTVCCVSALTSAARLRGDDRLLQLALEGARGVWAHLGIANDGPRSWFRYWPGDDTCIVNLQALIAGCFQRLGVVADDRTVTAHARLAADAALAAQRPDGSFPYAVDRRGQFVDAFHSGFVLEGLTRFWRSGGDAGDRDAQTSVSRGMDYLRTHLIDQSGRPRTGPGGPAAQDGQNVGQLIQTLVLCGNDADRRSALALWDQWGRSAPFQRDSGAAVPAEGISLRWDVGPMTLAASHLAIAHAGTR